MHSRKGKQRRSKAVLRRQWRQLCESHDSPQDRGFALEQLILELSRIEGLDCWPSFRPMGEQIDGMIEFAGRYWLLECKWNQDSVATSEVYSFRAKVEGKLSGGLGLFISVGGFSNDVPQVLRYGKEINVLLMDRDDLEYALEDRYRLAEVLQAKLVRAAQYGEVYFRFANHLDELGIARLNRRGSKR